MKLIIDIDKDDYEYMKNGYVPSTFKTFSVIKNGTPIPDNATVCDIDAIREEITEMIEREEVYHTKDARAQIIALEWALEVIESHTKGESEDKE